MHSKFCWSPLLVLDEHCQLQGSLQEASSSNYTALPQGFKYVRSEGRLSSWGLLVAAALPMCKISAVCVSITVSDMQGVQQMQTAVSSHAACSR